MYAALGQIAADWMAAHPFAERLPDWLVPPSRRLDPPPVDPAARAGVVLARADIDAHVNTGRDGTRTSFRQRRAVGEQLAGYLEQHSLLSQEHVLKLRACRCSGTWGVQAEGGRLVVAWDSKCSLTLLCPHCARTEQRRLVRRYKDPMKRWKQQRASRRIHSGVFTWPNVTPGELAGKLRLVFRWFRRVSQDFPSIKGYVATVEAPLSRRGDWNLHLNVLLCVEGPLHWRDLIAAWHRKTVHLFPGYEGTRFQVELRQLPRYDDDTLDAALRELIKYPAKHVTEKSNGKAVVSGRGAEGDRTVESLAPVMTEWPPVRFTEWWGAHRRYRRTRSYGCLFGEHLEELSGDIEDRPRGEVTWYGRLWWEGRSQGYVVSAPTSVGLIQANNSNPGTGPPGPKSAQSVSTGPPGPGPGHPTAKLAPGG